MRGEIREVRRAAWATEGHEYDSQHPVLVMGNSTFAESRMTLVVPVMSPAREHENWWEVNLTDCGDPKTCALPTGLRTITKDNLRSYVDTAGPGDLDQVTFTLEDYLAWDATWPKPGFHRGAVYRELRRKRNGEPNYCAILRHNPYNGVALTMAIGEENPLPGTDAVSLNDYPELEGQRLLHTLVKPSSVNHRLGGFVTTLKNDKVSKAIKKLLATIRPSEPRPLSVP
jgi:mRNA-degrading endonuclease toxin of MazEF toxin-antitoxin module